MTSPRADDELAPPLLPPLPPRRHRPERTEDQASRRTGSSIVDRAGPAEAHEVTHGPRDETGGARGPGRQGHRSLWPVAASVALATALLLYAYGTWKPRSDDYPIYGLLLLPLLTAVVAFVTRRMTARETRFDLRGILLCGFAIRGVGAYLRFVAPVDAVVYHREGSRIASELRNLNFLADTGRDTVVGTGWIRYVSGLSHAFIADDMFSTFLVFTFLSFTGAVLLYAAFARAVPNGDHRRYALLIFLWPSLVYWPSSIGKEAWMVFGLGIAAWGAARVHTGAARVGLPVFALGIAVLAMVRPHIALMVLIAMAVSLVARPGPQGSVRLFARVASVLLLVVGGSVLAGRTAEFFNLDRVGTESVASALEETQERTEQGGAAFAPAVVRTPLDYPVAFVTVWFRPFPFEARSGGIATLLSAAENLALVGLFAWSWRRLVALPRIMLRTPYVMFAVTYTILFVYAFAVIANFGILARQRTQGLVLLFVLLCIPPKDRTAPGTRGAPLKRWRRAPVTSPTQHEVEASR